MKRINNPRNKKSGQAEYLMQNAFRIGFLMVALLAFFLIVNYYINNKLDTQSLQAEVLKYRILYSSTINYQDSGTGRVYTGILDLKNFNDDSLKSGIDYGYAFPRHAAAKLKLLKKELGTNGDPIWYKDAYLNKPMYDNWKVLIDNGAQGRGSATIYVSRVPVSYLDFDNKYYYGTLVIEIIIPNS